MTERLFLEDAQCREARSRVLSASPDAIILDRTIFYARSGGQPGDVGVLRWDGGETPIVDTIKGEGETILHVPAPGAALPEGEVTGVVEWGPPPRAYAHAHRHAPDVRGAPRRRRHRRQRRRGTLAAGFRHARAAGPRGDRGRR